MKLTKLESILLILSVILALGASGMLLRAKTLEKALERATNEIASLNESHKQDLLAKDEEFGHAQDIIGYMTTLAVQLDSVFTDWQNMSISYDKFARDKCFTWDGYTIGNIYDSYEYGALVQESKQINQRYAAIQESVGQFMELLNSVEPETTKL